MRSKFSMLLNHPCIHIDESVWIVEWMSHSILSNVSFSIVHICMRHCVWLYMLWNNPCTRMNESWHTRVWVMVHVWMSVLLSEWVILYDWMSPSILFTWMRVCVRLSMFLNYPCHIWMGHGTHAHESWRTYEWVILDCWVNEPFYIPELVVPYCWAWVMAHVWLRHGVHMNQSCLRTRFARGSRDDALISHVYSYISHLWLIHMSHDWLIHMSRDWLIHMYAISHTWLIHMYATAWRTYEYDIYE